MFLLANWYLTRLGLFTGLNKYPIPNSKLALELVYVLLEITFFINSTKVLQKNKRVDFDIQ